MLTQIAKSFIRIGRHLERKLPRLANSALGRAGKAAIKELAYPTTGLTWRRSLPRPEFPESHPGAETARAGNSPTPLKNPDALADFTSPFIEHDCPPRCDIVMCCAFAGRHQLLARIVNDTLSETTLNVRWILAGSTTADEQFIRTMADQDSRITGFTCANHPLGRKWQTCVHKATNFFDSELYCISGSADIVSKKLLNSIVARHRKTLEFTNGLEHTPGIYCAMEYLVWYTNDRSNLSPNILKCSYEFSAAYQPHGTGRFYTRKFLDSCGDIIFDSRLEKSLDDRGFQRILDQRAPIEYYSLEDGPLLSIKGDWIEPASFDAFLNLKSLVLDEYSFPGYFLLEKSLSPPMLQFLSKQIPSDLKFPFQTLNSRMGIPDGQ